MTQPRYSPDGRFVWDGTGWRPIQPAHQQPGSQQPWPQRPGARRSGGAPVSAKPRTGMPAVLAIMLMVVAGGMVGGGAGAAVGAASSTRHGPERPGRQAAAFPEGGSRYLKGVTVTYLADKWLKGVNKWACKPWTDNRPRTGAKKWLCCTTKDESKYDVGVDIEYDDDTHVTRVSAGCELGPGTRFCTRLIANAAGEVLASQSKSLRDQGHEWGAKHADSDSATVLGGIRFRVELEPHGITALPASP